ncbi:MAG: hypothetical protein ACREA0_14315, partial [bacterium]
MSSLEASVDLVVGVFGIFGDNFAVKRVDRPHCANLVPRGEIDRSPKRRDNGCPRTFEVDSMMG